MASRGQLTQQIMQDLGKMGADVQRRVDALVGEVTVDLLTQNDGRFTGLQKTHPITAQSGDSSFILPADFNTAEAFFAEVDSDGKFLRQIEVVREKDIYVRKEQEMSGDENVAYIRHMDDGADGPGEYLIFAEELDTARYFRFFYFRKPTENDTDLIENTTIVKKGVKAQLPDLNPIQFQQDTAIYFGMREHFRENPTARINEVSIRPSKRTQTYNRMMGRIGRGG